MIIGKVKWFNAERGYGFICINKFDEAFVHHTAINMEGFRTLVQGEKVQYDLARGNNGYMALNVTPLK